MPTVLEKHCCSSTRKCVSIMHQGTERLDKLRQWRDCMFCSSLLYLPCFVLCLVPECHATNRKTHYNAQCLVITCERSGLIDLLHCFAFVYKKARILHVRFCLLSTLMVNTCLLALLSLKYTLTLISEVFFEPMFSFEQKEDRGKNLLPEIRTQPVFLWLRVN